MKKIILCVILLTFSANLFGATYHGKDIDGVRYDAQVYSYDSSSFYSVQVKFSESDCTIYFPKGGYITVTLDDEEIDDPHGISAYDYKKSAFWDIDLTDFE